MCVCVREKVRSASLVYEHYHWFLVWIMCRFFFSSRRLDANPSGASKSQQRERALDGHKGYRLEHMMTRL